MQKSKNSPPIPISLYSNVQISPGFLPTFYSIIHICVSDCHVAIYEYIINILFTLHMYTILKKIAIIISIIVTLMNKHYLAP